MSITNNKQEKNLRDVDVKPLVRKIFESTSEKEVAGELQPAVDLSVLESLGAKFKTPIKKNLKLEDYKQIFQKLNEASALSSEHTELKEFTEYLVVLACQLKRVMFS